MQIASTRPAALFKRALTSLAAILAVTTIFAVKAAEWEKRAEIAHAQQPKLAKTATVSGS